MKKRRACSLSLGLLAALVALACILSACPTEPEPEPTTYTVTFDVDGGSAVPSKAVEPGGKVTKPADPARDGYTFAGWYKESAKTNLWNFDTDTVTKNTTIYAKWVKGSLQSYTVTFDADGGAPVPAEQTVVSGEKVRRPQDPAKEGHTFVDWYKDKDGKTPWNFDWDTVTGPTTIYARWVGATTQVFTVTFDVDGGSEVESKTVVSGEKVLQPADPTKDGYVFKGWHKDANKTTLWNFGTDTVTKNTTIYAKWVRSYTVTFDAGGGSEVSSQTVESGGKVTKPPDPTRAGHTFDGWHNESTLWDFTTDTVTRSITLTARWTEAIIITFTGFFEEEINLGQGDGQILSQNNDDHLTVSVSGIDGSHIRWRWDGHDWGDGTERTIWANDFSQGPHTVSALVEKDGKFYSKTLGFQVAN